MLVLFKDNSNNEILVYYEDKIIKRINPNIDNTYTVEGYLGDVVIEVKDKKVRVKEETSPYHLCSKQSFISNSYTPIICLPNKIVIKFSQKEDIDEVVY